MRYSVLLVSALSLASYVAAQDIDASDLPTQCKDVCAPVVSLTAPCDKKTSDDDDAEKNCVCKDPRAAKSIPVCAACLTKHGKDGSDNDANDLVRSCSLTTTSFSPMTTTSMSGSSASTTGDAGAMTSGTSTSGTTIESTSGMSSMSGTGSISSTTAASTSNAANRQVLPGTGIVGAVLAGLMALV